MRRLGYVLQNSGFKSGSRTGQILIEAIIALSALTIGFLGILALLSSSLSLNRVISDNYTATYLAAEGIEVVKNAIDRNYILQAGGSLVPWNNNLSEGTYEVEYDSLAPFDIKRNILQGPNCVLSRLRAIFPLKPGACCPHRTLDRVRQHIAQGPVSIIFTNAV